jgi:2-aminomuconate deaminase
MVIPEIFQHLTDYTFFYSIKKPFSQWYPADFEIDGIMYNCANQYMMYQKACFCGDMIIAAEILASHTPEEQKALGRKIKNFNGKSWQTLEEKVVYCGNYAKFTQNPDLLATLLNTKGTLLVNASPSDTIWGIGLSATDAQQISVLRWPGRNRLGFILTKLREDLLALLYSHSPAADWQAATYANEKQDKKTVVHSARAPEPVGHYPHARRVGNLLFLSGVGPRQRDSNTIPGVTLAPDNKTILSYDIETQCHSVFDNVRAILEDAGSAWENIIDVTVFLTNMEKDFKIYNQLWKSYFAQDPPCRTTLEIKSLPTPIAIELKVIATID